MTVVDPQPRERTNGAGALPPIGVWWTMLERPLQREILENPTAPLRQYVVVRICELCEVEPVRADGIRLSEYERAYLAGWTHSLDRF